MEVREVKKAVSGRQRKWYGLVTTYIILYLTIFNYRRYMIYRRDIVRVICCICTLINKSIGHKKYNLKSSTEFMIVETTFC